MAVVIIQPEPGPPGPPGPPGTIDNPEVIAEAVGEYMTEHGDEILQDHIEDETPHKAYDDDMPSLVLIFENHLI